MNVLIFGAGRYGAIYKKYLVEKEKDKTFVGFLDNKKDDIINRADENLFPVYEPKELSGIDFDLIVISNLEAQNIFDIRKQLTDLNVPDEKITILSDEKHMLLRAMINYNHYDENTDPRVRWLHDYSIYVEENQLIGNVAECGVFRGDFAYYINKFFNKRTLYLFDTFEGFDGQDIEIERAMDDEAFIKGVFNETGKFKETNEVFVLDKMLFRQQCIVKKGLFPDSAAEINDKFVFVNLDMDLYQPTISGIEFFYEKMCEGGIILVHDYFHEELPGVKKAVHDYEKKRGIKLHKTPIGDGCSIAIVK